MSASGALEAGRKLIERLKIARMFDSAPDLTPAARHLIMECGLWLDDVDRNIGSFAPAEALELSQVYDLVHRAARRSPAIKLINNQFTRAFEAWIHGDRRVDPTDLMVAADAGLRRRDPHYLGKVLDWYSRTIGRWHRQFAQTRTFADATPRQARLRASILLAHDLTAYDRSPSAFKHLLRAAYPRQ